MTELQLTWWQYCEHRNSFKCNQCKKNWCIFTSRFMHLNLSHRIDVLLPFHGLIHHWCYTYKCRLHGHYISQSKRFSDQFPSHDAPIRSSRGPRQPIRTFHTMFGHPRLESCCPVPKERRAQRVSLTTLMETAPSWETLSQTSQNSSPFSRWVCACASLPEYRLTVQRADLLVDWSLNFFPSRSSVCHINVYKYS